MHCLRPEKTIAVAVQNSLGISIVLVNGISHRQLFLKMKVVILATTDTYF